MQDFNDFVNQNKKVNKPEGLDDNIFNMISSLASRFDGKNQKDFFYGRQGLHILRHHCGTAH